MKKYITPEIEVDIFDQEDIIMISGVDALQGTFGEIEANELGLN